VVDITGILCGILIGPEYQMNKYIEHQTTKRGRDEAEREFYRVYPSAPQTAYVKHKAVI
jgi:hypothetical protein